MSEQKPDSILFSLNELRRIEEKRVEGEDPAKALPAEPELQAKASTEPIQCDKGGARLPEQDPTPCAKQAQSPAESEEGLRFGEPEGSAPDPKHQRSGLAVEATSGSHRLRNTIIAIVAVLVAGAAAYFLHFGS